MSLVLFLHLLGSHCYFFYIVFCFIFEPKHKIMIKDTFQQEVYDVVAAIPSGQVVTYGQIAYLVGKPQCSRMVGHAMHNLPSEFHLPCHRVVNSRGRLAPFWEEQRTLLEIEGVKFKRNGCVDLKVSQWQFMNE